MSVKGVQTRFSWTKYTATHDSLADATAALKKLPIPAPTQGIWNLNFGMMDRKSIQKHLVLTLHKLVSNGEITLITITDGCSLIRSTITIPKSNPATPLSIIDLFLQSCLSPLPYSKQAPLCMRPRYLSILTSRCTAVNTQRFSLAFVRDLETLIRSYQIPVKLRIIMEEEQDVKPDASMAQKTLRRTSSWAEVCLSILCLYL